MGWCYLVTPLSCHSLLSLDAVEPLNSPGGPTNAAQSPAGRAASLRPSGHVGTAQTFCNPASSCSVPIACLLFRYSVGWVFLFCLLCSVSMSCYNDIVKRVKILTLARDSAFPGPEFPNQSAIPTLTKFAFKSLACERPNFLNEY